MPISHFTISMLYYAAHARVAQLTTIILNFDADSGQMLLINESFIAADMKVVVS
jgi:hypothetical protein